MLADAVFASHYMAGIRTRNFDNATTTLDLDVTVFYNATVTNTTAWLGGFYYGIFWGDGAAEPPHCAPPCGGYSPGLPFASTTTPPGASVPVKAYRQGFSHTYGTPGVYDVTVTSAAFGGTPTFPILFTGYPIFSPAGYASVALAANNVNIGVGFGGDLGSGGGTASGAIPIDTVSDIGLLLLALALGVTGVFLLRR